MSGINAGDAIDDGAAIGGDGGSICGGGNGFGMFVCAMCYVVNKC